MKPCNFVNCTLGTKCSLNLLVSFVSFDIFGGIKRASSNAVPSKFLPFM